MGPENLVKGTGETDPTSDLKAKPRNRDCPGRTELPPHNYWQPKKMTPGTKATGDLFHYNTLIERVPQRRKSTPPARIRSPYTVLGGATEAPTSGARDLTQTESK